MKSSNVVLDKNGYPSYMYIREKIAKDYTFSGPLKTVTPENIWFSNEEERNLASILHQTLAKGNAMSDLNLDHLGLQVIENSCF